MHYQVTQQICLTFCNPLEALRFGWGGLALSPEGELLAVNSGPVVQLYRLPEVGSLTRRIGDCSGDKDVASSRPALAHRQPDSPIKMVAPSQLVEKALS
jgi:hypothetical protein